MHKDFYLSLITSEHAQQPLFAEMVKLLTNALVDNVDLGLSLIDKFDLDQAEGVQLDAIGLWVGIGRNVATPLTGVYFEWDGAAAVGWGNGYWKGAFDPATGLTTLGDDIYRVLIRGKIAANIWDGTLEGMYAVWDYVFGPDIIETLDNQDMTITVVYDDLALSTVMKELLTSNAFPLKPAGVRIIYLASSGAPLFAWDFNTTKFQGWNGVSVWAS